MARAGPDGARHHLGPTCRNAGVIVTELESFDSDLADVLPLSQYMTYGLGRGERLRIGGYRTFRRPAVRSAQQVPLNLGGMPH
jgi:hypothetical protein